MLPETSQRNTFDLYTSENTVKTVRFKWLATKINVFSLIF